MRELELRSTPAVGAGRLLRVTSLRAGSAGYYLAEPADALGPGRWVGQGAAGLGLVGPVAAADLEAALAGQQPVTGRALTRRRGSVAGFDLTFAAPKSVSVLWGVGGPEVAPEVLDAHERAVDSAMTYVAGHALSARRGPEAERVLVGVEGPVAASFTHGLSRAGDPHLHTHVVVANVGHGDDGRWTAVDGRGLHAHARAAGQLYDAHLRDELARGLGLQWVPRRNGAYELAMMDPAILGVLSARQAEIRQALGGRRSGRARTVAWAATRPPKTPSSMATHREEWHQRVASVLGGGDSLDTVALHRGAASIGVGGRTTEMPDGRRRVAGAVDEHRFAAALAGTPHAAAARRDAVAAWAGALETGSPGAEVGRCVDALAPWEPAMGVAEPRRALAGLVAPPHLLRTLGPRPATAEGLTVWQRAATAIERYRRTWHVTDRADALGVDEGAGALTRFPARRLAEHLVVVRELADAQRRLGRQGRRAPVSPELSLGR